MNLMQLYDECRFVLHSLFEVGASWGGGVISHLPSLWEHSIVSWGLFYTAPLM